MTGWGSEKAAKQLDLVSSRSAARPLQAKQVLGFDAVACSVKSEQAMLHSAPPPSSALLETNVTVSLFAVHVKLLGPEFWQNLESPKNENQSPCQKNTAANLWPPSPRER